MRNFTFSTLYLLLAAGLLARPGRAQTYLLPVSGMASYTTCAGTLYDDGGPSQPHDGSANGGVTLWPATAGAKLKLDFTDCEVDTTNSSVKVYDGPDTNAPLLGLFSAGHPVVYAQGSTGALTVVLTSYGYPLRGIAATISCTTASPPGPDLATLSVVPSTPQAPAGDDFTAVARVANLVGQAASFQVRYLLSADAVASANDVELGRTSSSYSYSLVAGTATSLWQQLSVPTGTAPGQYYLLAVTDLIGGRTEANRANNVAATPFRVPILSPGPDLTITALDISSHVPLAGNGYFYAVAWHQNTGQVPAQAAETGFYLSADATLSADDRLVGRQLVATPTTGRSTRLVVPVQLPGNLPPGSYYLLAVADHRDRVIEDNEQNNVLATPLLVGPPTAELSFTKRRTLAPTEVGAGNLLTNECVIQNLGSALVDSARVDYFLSADRLLDASDVPLGHRAAGPLYPDDTYTGYAARQLRVPAGTAPGRYYLLLVADYRNQVPETDETNNVAAMALSVVAPPSVDLALSGARNGSIYAPVAGATFYSRCTLLNQGSTAAHPAGVGYYLSADNQLSANDMLLGASRPAALAGGASLVVETQFALPAATAPGSYYLLFVADHLGQVAETDETNNLAAVPIQVQAGNYDLVPSTTPGVTPAPAAAGSTLQVSFVLANQGSTPAREPATGFYLSTDNQLSAGDVLLGEYRSYNTAYPGYPLTLSGTAGLPRTVAPGQYYLLAVADYLGEFAETDETNNVGATPLTVTAARPDLTLQATPYVAARQVAAGGTLATECYPYNVGAGPAGAFRVGYYLGRYPFRTPNDVLVGSTPAGPLAAGNADLLSGSLTVPVGTAPGRYYVVFEADDLRQTTDPVAQNNADYTTLTVTDPLAAREQLAGLELQVLPVPVAAPAPLRVQLLGGPHPAALTLYNALGQAVASRPLPAGPAPAELPTTGLAPGVYVLHLSGEGLYAVRRVVVE